MKPPCNGLPWNMCKYIYIESEHFCLIDLGISPPEAATATLGLVFAIFVHFYVNMTTKLKV